MRSIANPIIDASRVSPSQNDLEVVGAFNPAAVRIGDETLLLSLADIMAGLA